MKKKFSLSIISHGHRNHIRELLLDLAALNREDFDVTLTLNFPEDLPLDLNSLPYQIRLICNPELKGFAANHNAAFMYSHGEHFVILNPDIRVLEDPFLSISTYMRNSPNTICAPLIVNQYGELEDSARLIPTPFFLVKKLICKVFKLRLKPDFIPQNDQAFFPDWVAGMFVVVPHETYKQLGGLNENYHMYYEDVDFCVRAQLAGQTIAVVKNTKVIHEAQRDSHRKIQHFIWHLQSILKFFMSKSYLQLKLSRIIFFSHGR